MLREPHCFTRQCAHFLGVSQPDGTEKTERVVCVAFPDGIPDEIAYGDNPHTEPYPGDDGVLYEQADEE